LRVNYDLLRSTQQMSATGVQRQSDANGRHPSPNPHFLVVRAPGSLMFHPSAARRGAAALCLEQASEPLKLTKHVGATSAVRAFHGHLVAMPLGGD
jgi:hypothetical protein